MLVNLSVFSDVFSKVDQSEIFDPLRRMELLREATSRLVDTPQDKFPIPLVDGAVVCNAGIYREGVWVDVLLEKAEAGQLLSKAGFPDTSETTSFVPVHSAMKAKNHWGVVQPDDVSPATLEGLVDLHPALPEPIIIRYRFPWDAHGEVTNYSEMVYTLVPTEHGSVYQTDIPGNHDTVVELCLGQLIKYYENFQSSYQHYTAELYPAVWKDYYYIGPPEVDPYQLWSVSATFPGETVGHTDTGFADGELITIECGNCEITTIGKTSPGDDAMEFAVVNKMDTDLGAFAALVNAICNCPVTVSVGSTYQAGVDNDYFTDVTFTAKVPGLSWQPTVTTDLAGTIITEPTNIASQQASLWGQSFSILEITKSSRELSIVGPFDVEIIT